ncbi:MAG: response regulator [Myxococcales bacterium]|nr:response regulator [Myxococcales bacterium]
MTVPRLGRGETVLVAEDEPALRRVLARVLESAGYQVSVASDGKEAIRKIDALGSRLDVIVSDVVMPGCSGYEVADHAARVAPHAAVILSSGYVDDMARKNQRDDLPILWKPVPGQDLVRAVATAIAARRPTESATSGGAVTSDLVLVIEDDAAVRRGLVRILTTAGYTTTTASMVAEARQVLEVGPEPQLVLCDLSLPDGSGAEVVDFIQRTRPALCSRVLILSGATDEAVERLVESGAARRLLTKPIESNVLLEVLAGIRQTSRPPLPVVPNRSRAPSASPVSNPSSGPAPRKERVLVVDDDESLAAATTRILGNAGFDVVVAGTLAAARKALDAGDLDALVADVRLPDGDGFELIRDLRGENSELPVVMITGAPSIESATLAVRSRVHEYLSKPFSPEELVHVVRVAVNAGRVARLRTKLLAARFGGDEFVGDVATTEKRFAVALPKIRMAFQPIVRSGDGSVYGYEALLRCDEPSLSSPLRLLAAAEVLGRVNDVGRAVRASVAATVLAHPDRLEAIRQPSSSGARADLRGELTDPLVPLARRVVLEVTERAALESGPKLDDDLARIRHLGYRLAVDDLGEGYAGLSSLVNLRPDIAKIDMSLVRDIHRAPLKRDIVAALVDLARRSGIIVVAEGIETVDERDTLVDLGCELLQGYLFAKPGPPFPVPRGVHDFRRELETT